jgi:hypothetical protein
MILSMSRWKALLILALIAASIAAPNVAAEGAAVEESLRYELFTSNGARYRFDKKTSELDKLEFVNGMPTWVRQAVNCAGSDAVATKPSLTDQSSTQATGNKNQAQVTESHAAPMAAPIFIDDDGHEMISDADRRSAKAAIDGYESKLSILQTVKVGDRIEGTIMVRNSGDKKVRVMELTLLLNVNGGDKPEEHRLVFSADRKNPPPQPSAKGADGAALMRVNIPCPAGGVKGSPELKLTYLQFEN